MIWLEIDINGFIKGYTAGADASLNSVEHSTAFFGNLAKALPGKKELVEAFKMSPIGFSFTPCLFSEILKNVKAAVRNDACDVRIDFNSHATIAQGLGLLDIKINAKEQPTQPTLQVGIQFEGNNVVCYIVDNGQGFPEKLLNLDKTRGMNNGFANFEQVIASKEAISTKAVLTKKTNTMSGNGKALYHLCNLLVKAGGSLQIGNIENIDLGLQAEEMVGIAPLVRERQGAVIIMRSPLFSDAFLAQYHVAFSTPYKTYLVDAGKIAPDEEKETALAAIKLEEDEPIITILPIDDKGADESANDESEEENSDEELEPVSAGTTTPSSNSGHYSPSLTWSIDSPFSPRTPANRLRRLQLETIPDTEEPIARTSPMSTP